MMPRSAVDVQVVGADADGLKHGDEQGGLVFAVTVAIAIDVAGIVRLPAADAPFDDEVADVLLDVAR
jgi:imidazoleglycerol phosphate dehydratase HisB